MAQGRRRSAAEWQGIVESWAASGLGRDAFAKQVGVRPSTLGWWRGHFRRTGTAARFVEVAVEAVPAEAARVDFVVELAGAGHRVRVTPGFDAGELRRLVHALC